MCPMRATLFWISFNPQAGRERAGHRPAVVLSPATYNAKTREPDGLLPDDMKKIKNYPFEVAEFSVRFRAPDLTDRVKSLDWRKRRPSEKG